MVIVLYRFLFSDIYLVIQKDGDVKSRRVFFVGLKIRFVVRFEVEPTEKFVASTGMA